MDVVKRQMRPLIEKMRDVGMDTGLNDDYCWVNLKVCRTDAFLSQIKFCLRPTLRSICFDQVRVFQRIRVVLTSQNTREINQRMDKLIADVARLSEELFTAMDVDHDHRITREEFLNGYIQSSAAAFGQFTMPHS